MVKDCLKSALVAEVNLSKMTKEANLVSFPCTSFQIVFPPATLVKCRGRYSISQRAGQRQSFNLTPKQRLLLLPDLNLDVFSDLDVLLCPVA